MIFIGIIDMNKLWFSIIVFSICFGLINNNVNEMVSGLFNVSEEVLNSIFKIGTMLIIYNGLFNIAIESKCINILSKRFYKVVKKIFYLNGSEIIDLISTSIICNMMGLGAANMAIAIKIIDKLRFENNRKYNITMYLFINISSFCVLPLSLLTLRASFNSLINIEFIPLILITTLLTTLFAILLCKLIYRGDNIE